MSCVSWSVRARRSTPPTWCWTPWSSGRRPAAAAGGGVPRRPAPASPWAPSTASRWGPPPTPSPPSAAAPAPPATPWARSSLWSPPAWGCNSNPPPWGPSPRCCPSPARPPCRRRRLLRTLWTSPAPCNSGTGTRDGKRRNDGCPGGCEKFSPASRLQTDDVSERRPDNASVSLAFTVMCHYA